MDKQRKRGGNNIRWEGNNLLGLYFIFFLYGSGEVFLEKKGGDFVKFFGKYINDSFLGKYIGGIFQKGFMDRIFLVGFICVIQDYLW